MTRTSVLAAGSCALAVLAGSSAAHAFSDADVFAAPAMEGGGEGRYFTGSRSDPYSCSVCHAGGKAPEITITGLPERIEPGERSEVTIRWREPETSHALQLELATADGAHAGLELTGPDDLPRQQRCEQLETGDPAVYSVALDARRVLGVSDCGASELRFSFTAPDDAELILSLGVVRSDGSGTPDGDGVLELRRRIGPGATSEGGGCRVTKPGAAAGGEGFVLVLAYLVVSGLFRGPTRRYAWLAGIVLACLGGCYQPSVEANERPRGANEIPSVDAFEEILNGERGDGAAQCTTSRPRDGSVEFRVRTVSADGRYRPRNIGAIWIAGADGNWVKTLERWGVRRAKWLTAWNEVSGGDVTDAITSPTLPMHRVHEVSWDRTDRDGCEVEPGDYQVQLEMTDWSGTGTSTSIPFSLGDEPVALKPEDVKPFLEMELRIE